MSGDRNHSEVALKSFERLLSLLATIPDPRRAEGKLYQLRHVLLFSIFAMISGANSYRELAHLLQGPPGKAERSLRDRLEKRARAYGDPLYLAPAQRRRRSKRSFANTPPT